MIGRYLCIICHLLQVEDVIVGQYCIQLSHGTVHNFSQGLNFGIGSVEYFIKLLLDAAVLLVD